MLTADYLNDMRSGLTAFHAETAEFIHQYRFPVAGSKAQLEQASSTRSESIITAWSLGNLLLEHGGDHVTAFVKTATEPVEVIACWTCVRSMLESCALATWILDPSIDAQTRIARVFAHRYEGMIQQLKFGRCSTVSSAEITAAEHRLVDVEKDAIAAGFPAFRDKHGDISAIAMRMPNATTMIKDALDEEKAYRLLSGVAHGHSWALKGLSFQPSGPDKMIGPHAVTPHEKTTGIQGFAFLGMLVFKSLARPLWNISDYFGWNQLQLEEILENAADKLRALPVVRFWRP